MRTGTPHAGILLILGLLGGLAISTASWAQAGFYVTPSFSFAEVYDDNLFSTSSGRESDIYTSFSPSLKAGYQSAPLTLLGSYGFDAQVYPGHPELTSALASQLASIEARYLPTRLLSLSFTGAYAESQTSRNINVLTGIDEGRQRSELYSFSPSVGYQFGPLTSGRAGYVFTQVASGVSSNSHTLNLGLSRQLTPRDTGNLGFNQSLFSSGQDKTLSFGFTLGWTRQLTAFTNMALQGGPQLTEGSVGANVSASISHRLKHGGVSFSFLQTQALVAGLANAVNTQVFTGSISYEPLRLLQVGATPFFSRNTPVESEQGNAETKVYGLGLNANYQLNRWLALQSSYQFSFQQGTLTTSPLTATGDDGNIYHNIVSVGLAITYPYRVY
jgi:hypothetical protein